MTTPKHAAQLRFEGRPYPIAADFILVREIEHEIGSLALLHERLTTGAWTVSELVTLIHMMLQSANKTVDYLHLGHIILNEGLSRYHATAVGFTAALLGRDA